MKSTGLSRRIDDLGRIVIPKEIRKQFFDEPKNGYSVGEGEMMEFFIEDDTIILKRVKGE